MRTLLFIILIVLIGCKPQTTNKPLTSPDDSTSFFGAEDTQKIRLNNIQSLANEKKATELKKNFKTENDQFNNVSFYWHKNWRSTWPNRNCLYAYFNTRGTLFLISNYHADDWIFHTSAKILIGQETMETSDVETYSEWNKTDNNGDGVYENVSHFEEEDKKIIEWIANNTNKEIKVRLEGRQYYKDFVISASDKKAFKDTWELYRALY